MSVGIQIKNAVKKYGDNTIIPDLSVNIKNGDTLPFMEKDDVVEIATVIGKDGAKPVRVDVDNRHVISLMRIVKEYEKYAVEAALTGSDTVALNALLVHPLIGDWENALKCFEEMKEAHKEYLPQFFGDKE